MTFTLYGYRPSIYTWIVHLTLREKSVVPDWVEVDPFGPMPPGGYDAVHPFARVPALQHDGRVVYETTAITRYVDEVLPSPPLVPETVVGRTRMNQIIAVADSYAYWPFVRQIYVHGLYRPRTGGEGDPAMYAAGCERAPRVLDAFEGLYFGATYLTGPAPSLADMHLAPMIACLAATVDGRRLLEARRQLWAWWVRMAQRPTLIETVPPGFADHWPPEAPMSGR